MNPEYLEDKNSDDFIKYIFSTNPKPKNHIKLELDEPPKGIHNSLHIYMFLLKETYGNYVHRIMRQPINNGI